MRSTVLINSQYDCDPQERRQCQPFFGREHQIVIRLEIWLKLGILKTHNQFSAFPTQTKHIFLLTIIFQPKR